MSRASAVAPLLSSLALLTACTASTGPGPGASERPVTAGPAAASEAPSTEDAEAAAFRAALERVDLAAGGGDDLHLFTECRRDAGLDTVEVFGSGVGLWQGRGQFRIGAADRARMLEALVELDYAGMPESFGGKGTGETGIRSRDEVEEGEGIFALRVICRIEATVGGVSKAVVQFDKGYISRELLDLAARLLEVGEELAGELVVADSLADGLEKVGTGVLAPEAFELLLHRKPERQEATEEGFLLRVSSGTASSRVWATDVGYGPTVELSLDKESLSELARALRAASPEELPINLYSPVYTDLTVSVLDREVTLQARRFAGMTESTHGKRQQVFDRLYATLERLHERVQAEGRAAVGG